MLNRVLNTPLVLFYLRNNVVTAVSAQTVNLNEEIMKLKIETYLSAKISPRAYSKLNQNFCFVTSFKLLQIVSYYESFTVFWINMTKYGFEGSQQLNISKVKGCVAWCLPTCARKPKVPVNLRERIVNILERKPR